MDMKGLTLTLLLIAGCGEDLFEIGELSCHADYLNEWSGGLLYLYSISDEGGNFIHTYEGGVKESVTGYIHIDEGDFEYLTTYDEGYYLVEELVRGSAAFEEDGDGVVSGSLLKIYIDGSEEESTFEWEREGCWSTMVFHDPEGHGVVDEIILSPEGLSFRREYEDETGGIYTLSVGDAFDDWTSSCSFLMTAAEWDGGGYCDVDGEGEGKGEMFMIHREGEMAGGWTDADFTNFRNGDTEHIWEYFHPDAPTSPYLYGVTYQYFDGSGYSDFSMDMGEDEVTCHREWDEGGHGYMECDNGYYEEF